MKELILTGHEDFWPDKPDDCYFLSPWCFSNNHFVSFANQESFKLIDPPWTVQTMKPATNVIISLRDRINETIWKQLNTAVTEPRTQAYWKTVVTPWLTFWLWHMYDRFCRIEYATRQVPQGTLVKIAGVQAHGYNDVQSYQLAMAYYHDLNLDMMSQIIRVGFSGFFRLEELQQKLKNVGLPSTPHFVSHRYTLFLAMKNLVSCRDMILEPVLYRTFKNLFFVSLKMRGGLAVKIPSFNFKEIDVDMQKLKVLNFNPKNNFERIIAETIFYFIPKQLLTNSCHFEGSQKSWIGWDAFNDCLRGGAFRDKGGRLYCVQHGGGYKIYNNFLGDYLEPSLAEKFFTWSSHPAPNSATLPTLFFKELLNSKIDKKAKFYTFFSTNHPVYSYNNVSALQPESQLKYLKEKFRFFESIDHQKLANFRVRPYFHDYGSGELAQLRKMQIPLHFEGSGADAMRTSMLCVFDHPMTGIWESLVGNFPSIIYFSPDVFYLNEYGRDLFEILKVATIYHETADSAARLFNEIKTDPYTWWQSENVQKARSDVIASYISKFASSIWDVIEPLKREIVT